jgi:probable HAF family extracellular repeat protein
MGRIAAVAAVVALAILAAGGGLPASADPPPAAAGTTSHGFLARGGVLTRIDHPAAAAIPSTVDGQTGTGTLGINDRGQVLGVYESRDRVVRHFVRDRRGRYTIIADPPGTSGDRLSYETVDINNRGEIVGFYNDDQGSTTSGFLRTKRGRFTDITVPGSVVTGPLKINDRRQVVGIYADAGGGVHGFLWDDGKFSTIDVAGAAATVVIGINDRGQMVGSYIDADGAYHGFLRDRRGAVTTLPDAPGAAPGSGGTQPASINERGQIVGVAYDAAGGSRGFLFERGRFKTIAGPAATYTRALDVNNRGQIVGDYGTKPTVAARGSTARRADRGRGLQLGASGGWAWLP